VVIPSLNEERNLPRVLEQLPKDVDEIVLVDGRSTDRTIEVAREIVPHVRVVEQRGRGKGNALQEGFAVCSGDAIVMLDADGSMDPAEIPSFVDALRGGAEMVKGSRFLPMGGSDDLTSLRKVGNMGLRTVFNLLYGARHTDLCYGYVAFWRRCLPALAFDHSGFEVETVLCIRAAQAGMRVTEIPSYELCRQHGQSNLRTFRDGFRILGVLLSENGRVNEAQAFSSSGAEIMVDGIGAGSQPSRTAAHVSADGNEFSVSRVSPTGYWARPRPNVDGARSSATGRPSPLHLPEVSQVSPDGYWGRTRARGNRPSRVVASSPNVDERAAEQSG
jgi:hypothetical protein